MIKFTNARLVKDGEVFLTDFFVKDGFFEHIGESHFECDEVIDLKNMLTVPGFLDCHTHGFLGYHSEGTTEELREMALKYAARGTTGFYATIGPRTNEEYIAQFKRYRNAFSSDCEGAEFLGLHLEGPFLNPAKKGAMNEADIRQVDMESLKELVEEGKDLIKMMTIAPELPDALQAINYLVQKGIRVSMGHTNATQAEAALGIEYGASRVTHCFNAMRSFNHREPGILGEVMINDDVYCELIMDGAHVSRAAMELLIRSKGSKQVIAISDGGSTCGLQIDNGPLSNGYFVENGAVVDEEGTLSGSIRDLANHFEYAVNVLSLTVEDAIRLTSANCADHMAVKAGKIERGYPANFNCLSANSRLIKTYMYGSEVPIDRKNSATVLAGGVSL